VAKELPVCVVRLEDGAMKFYMHHEPMKNAAGQALRFNLSAQGTEGGEPAWQGVMVMCRRCALAYVAASQHNLSPVPKDTVMAPGGNA